MPILSPIRLLILLFTALAFSCSVSGQSVPGIEARLANLIGTVTDLNGDPVPNATVVLETSARDNPRTVITPENGYFEFHDVKPGTPYQINITATDFADWTSPTITLEAGEFKIVTGIQLRIEVEHTEVDVHYDPVEVATEQFKAEEQ